MNKEEKEYLAGYDITKYERPSVAVDMAVFSIMDDGERDNFRKLQKKALKILLIRRASYPYKDFWALPGGFCRPGEDVRKTAERELVEETNIDNAYLSPVGIFGEAGRDPRGWIISNTFLALMDGEKCKLRAGTDAWEAKWFSVQLEQKEIKKAVKADSANLETEYEIRLVYETGENDEKQGPPASGTTNKNDSEIISEFNKQPIILSAKIKEYKEFKQYHETVRYEILESDGIAFDHGKIILHALLAMRKKVDHDSKRVFDLMPELFTLTQLQNAFELILDVELLTANFRRKIADYVIETEQIIEGAGHRPAKLFKRNVKEFYK